MNVHDEIIIPGPGGPPRRDAGLAGRQPSVARGKGPDGRRSALPVPGHGVGAVRPGSQPGDQHRHRQRQVPGLPGTHPTPPGHPSEATAIAIYPPHGNTPRSHISCYVNRFVRGLQAPARSRFSSPLERQFSSSSLHPAGGAFVGLSLIYRSREQQALQFIREGGYLTSDLPHLLLGQLLRPARIRNYCAANRRTQRLLSPSFARPGGMQNGP